MLNEYRQHVAERAELGIPPLPINPEQMAALVELLKSPPAGEDEFLMDLLENRVPAGVDKSAYVKAAFLSDVAKGTASSPLITAAKAVELLGTMLGGYNVGTLIELLADADLGALAADQLKGTLLIFDAFHDVEQKAKAGNINAKNLIRSWADAEWFTQRPVVPERITLTVFMVEGETNTDDLSPAPDAWSRPDIPLHGLAMLKIPRPGVDNALVQIEELKQKGHPLVYVGDVVGTGSSRKSATNSVLWHMGDDIPRIPNKRAGGVCLGGKIAPIFFNTMEDSGALPIECDVAKMSMGDVITVLPMEGRIEDASGQVISNFSHRSDVILDEVRAGGRIPLI
ncbi:MAG: aconitate hydratase 2/2-methylisocitrate dehydratase, partial [Planctomycetota bacterium]